MNTSSRTNGKSAEWNCHTWNGAVSFHPLSNPGVGTSFNLVVDPAFSIPLHADPPNLKGKEEYIQGAFVERKCTSECLVRQWWAEGSKLNKLLNVLKLYFCQSTFNVMKLRTKITHPFNSTKLKLGNFIHRYRNGSYK